MPLDCDKIDACAKRVDALSKRFDNYVRVRKDAKDEPSYLARALQLLVHYDDKYGNEELLNKATAAVRAGDAKKACQYLDDFDWKHGRNQILDRAEELLRKHVQRGTK